MVGTMETGQKRRLFELGEILERIVDVDIVEDFNLWAKTFTEPTKRSELMDTQSDRALYFNMSTHRKEAPCGTVCCALGLGCTLQYPSDLEFVGYSQAAEWLYGLVLYGPAYIWLFDGCWAVHPELGARTAKAAAHRIYYFLVHGSGYPRWWAAFLRDHPFDETKTLARAEVAVKMEVDNANS